MRILDKSSVMIGLNKLGFFAGHAWRSSRS